MYEKIIGVCVFTACLVAALIFAYFRGRRRGAEDNISGTRDYQQSAETDIRGAEADNSRAEEQNRELREDCDRAEELIKRGKEILGMGENN